MPSIINIVFLLIISANLLTSRPAFAVLVPIPPCPEKTERVYMPDNQRPVWTGCKDKEGQYQGFIIQLSRQAEILRVAGVKNSIREGREIRFGETGTLEERNFKNGHLNGKSFIFMSPTNLARIFPKKATADDWANFSSNSETPILKSWMNQEPITTIDFIDGRLSRLQFEKKDYKFNVTKDGRMFALNHPDMKKLFFTDTEPLWNLNAADLKLALEPGWGSCKQYAGPIGRFTRNYDHLLYKRESNERKHLEIFNEIRNRFIHFCVPEDIMTHLGKVECPPALPTIFPAEYCAIPISDQLHIPYQTKFFAYEFTLGRAPDELHEILREKGLPKFVNDYTSVSDNITLTSQVSVQVKRTNSGILFRPLEKDKDGRIKMKKEDKDSGGDDKNWYEWKRIPGY